MLQSYVESLEREIDFADIKLQGLHIGLVSTQQQIEATTRRYEKLENLTKLVCNECWSILPTLGHDVHDQAVTQIVFGLSCVNCGAILVTATTCIVGDEIELPPQPSKRNILSSLVAVEEDSGGESGSESDEKVTVCKSITNQQKLDLVRNYEATEPVIRNKSKVVKNGKSDGKYHEPDWPSRIARKTAGNQTFTRAP